MFFAIGKCTILFLPCKYSGDHNAPLTGWERCFVNSGSLIEVFIISPLPPSRCFGGQAGVYRVSFYCLL
jgi:hypothetical protein